jgi:hypothetical protein
MQDHVCDIKTLPNWMGHKDLASTMVNLKAVRKKDVMARVNSSELAALAVLELGCWVRSPPPLPTIALIGRHLAKTRGGKKGQIRRMARFCVSFSAARVTTGRRANFSVRQISPGTPLVYSFQIADDTPGTESLK